jgi:hypothetical protein
MHAELAQDLFMRDALAALGRETRARSSLAAISGVIPSSSTAARERLSDVFRVNQPARSKCRPSMVTMSGNEVPFVVRSNNDVV